MYVVVFVSDKVCHGKLSFKVLNEDGQCVDDLIMGDGFALMNIILKSIVAPIDIKGARKRKKYQK